MAAVVLAACGGSTDVADDADTPGVSASVAAADDAASTTSDETGGSVSAEDDGETGASDELIGDDLLDGSAVSGDFPFDGATVTVLDLGLGAYGIDRTTGASAAYTLDATDAAGGDEAAGSDDAGPGLAGDEWFTERTSDPISDGEVVYSMLLRQAPDFVAVEEVALGKLDPATGIVRVVREFGPTRPDDASTDTTRWDLIGAGGGRLWVEREAVMGDERVRRFVSIDALSGDVLGEVDPAYEFETDTASCAGEARALAVDDGGNLVVEVDGAPATVGEGGEFVTQFEPCDDPLFDVGATIAVSERAAFTVLGDGPPIPPDELDRLYDVEPRIVGGAAVVDDTTVSWVFSSTRTVTTGDGESVTAIIGGLATVDRTTGELQMTSLGDRIGTIVDGGDEPDTITALTDVDLHRTGDTVWILDRREDGVLFRVDVAEASVAANEIPLDPVGIEPHPDAGDGPRGTSGEGSRYTRATMVTSDPDGVWLDVSRFTITEDDAEGRSASGPSYVDQVDPDTGDVVRSIPESDLTGIEL